MIKAYKYRIYPTDEQKLLIDKTIGCCRLVYNLALQVKIEAYKANGTNLSTYDLHKQLTELKNEHEWLREVDSQALQAAVKNVELSFKGFFNGRGYPKFKSKFGKQNFQSNHPGGKRIDFNNGLLSAMKIKNIPIIISRRFEGKMKTVTISKTPTGKYFASILVDNGVKEDELVNVHPETTIGLDTGIKSFVISSDGRKFEANRNLKNNLKRLQCLQRRLSRKKKGGKNRKKAVKAVAVIHERISNKRLDYIHKVTHELTSDNQATSCVCIEDLNVSGLLKNRKLSQAMQDVSLGKFYEILGYKCKWRGINLIKIDRFAPSSKQCSICGTINQNLTLADREWECDNCGITHDRDLNAAVNIKQMGLLKFNSPVGSRGGPVELSALAGAKKQESNAKV